MSEREFDLYLELLAKFLRLRPGQTAEIADELRDHLEARLEEFSRAGCRGPTRCGALSTSSATSPPWPIISPNSLENESRGSSCVRPSPPYPSHPSS